MNIEGYILWDAMDKHEEKLIMIMKKFKILFN